MTNRLRYSLKAGIIGVVIGYNIPCSNNSQKVLDLEYYNANKQILKEIKQIKNEIYKA